MTTSDYLEQLVQDRDDLVDNLTTKGITGLTGDETFTELVPEVLNIPSGGGTTEVEEKDVNFYDYDGKLLYSYTKSQFLALESMPENPTHEGLTAQGWNWTLSQAKEFITNADFLDIGQIYITDDDKTRIYINAFSKGYLTPYIGIMPISEATVTINWGDGNEDIETISASTYFSHVYSTTGKYIISISTNNVNYRILGFLNSSIPSQSRALIFSGETNYANYIYAQYVEKFEMGKNVGFIGSIFTNCINLKSITLCNSGYELGADNLFESNKGLKHVNFPALCSHLLKMSILKNSNIETVSIGYQNSFLNSQCFEYSNLRKVSGYFNSMDSYCFRNSKNLQKISICILGGIGQGLFSQCSNLKKIDFNNFGKNEFTTNFPISSNALMSCISLLEVIMNPKINNISDNAFNNCRNVLLYDFRMYTQIPTLSNVNVFSYNNDNYKIVVPDDLYDDWIVTSNWSDSTIVNHIVSQSDYEAS